MPKLSCDRLQKLGFNTRNDCITKNNFGGGIDHVSIHVNSNDHTEVDFDTVWFKVTATDRSIGFRFQSGAFILRHEDQTYFNNLSLDDRTAVTNFVHRLNQSLADYQRSRRYTPNNVPLASRIDRGLSAPRPKIRHNRGN